MRSLTIHTGLFLLLITGIVGGARADEQQFTGAGGVAGLAEGGRYEVTFTNVTRGQIVTPPVLFSHKRSFGLFTPGTSAIPELAALAEGGVTGPLIGYLGIQPSVFDFVAGTGPILPGESLTLEIRVRGAFRYLSAVGMLATSNDAFFAVQGVRVPTKGWSSVQADAYDAGSEANSESCSYIPGPPCGSSAHDPGVAEGYVHIHGGIHGTGDIDPAAKDWRNPVVMITIRPIS